MKQNLKKEALLTQEELKKILHYDPETGVFTWRIATNTKIKVGSIAGWLNSKGYVRIKINGFEYLAHRLAFFYMTGSFPPNEVDHINNVRDDNRWENLRLCTLQENSFNRSMQKNNTSGFKGVFKNGKGWGVIIQLKGKHKYLGTFSTPELAAKIYEGHAKKLFGEFVNVNQQEGV